MKLFIIKKRYFVFSIIIVTIISLISFIPLNKPYIKVSAGINYCNTNEDRIKFLNSYGWKVNSEPFEVKTVIIPVEFNKIYENFNDLQLSQGYDLSAYKGITAKKYTYTIQNYPKVNIAYGDLYVYKNKVIAADVYTPGIEGIMHGLKYPNIKAG